MVNKLNKLHKMTANAAAALASNTLPLAMIYSVAITKIMAMVIKVDEVRDIFDALWFWRGYFFGTHYCDGKRWRYGKTGNRLLTRDHNGVLYGLIKRRQTCLEN